MKYIILLALIVMLFISAGCAKQPTINGEPVELIHTDLQTAYA